MRQHPGISPSTPTDPILVTIIIIGYNAVDSLEACLRSLVANRPSFRTEVLVVDNASPRSLREHVTPHLATGDKLLRLPENVGFARACNFAATRASGDYLLLLNPDAKIRPGTIESLVSAAERHPRAGVIGGRLVHHDGSLDPQSCWGRPSVWSMVCFASGLSTIFAGRTLFDPESLGQWQRDTTREVGIVTGCLLLSPRAVWTRLGGFDPDYFMYAEDADLCWRISHAGYDVIITPEAVATHEGGLSSSTSDKSVLLLRGKMTYLQKRFSGSTGRLVRILLVIGVAIRASLSRMTRRDDDGWTYGWQRRSEWMGGYPRFDGPRQGYVGELEVVVV